VLHTRRTCPQRHLKTGAPAGGDSIARHAGQDTAGGPGAIARPKVKGAPVGSTMDTLGGGGGRLPPPKRANPKERTACPAICEAVTTAVVAAADASASVACPEGLQRESSV
jgi:hypothetical protein